MPSRPAISWRAVPFGRLLLPLLMGIVLAWFFPFPGLHSYFLLLLGGFLLLGLYRLPRAIDVSLRSTLGATILLWLLVFGYWRGQDYREDWQPTHFSNSASFVADSSYYWSGKITSIRPGTERLRLSLALNQWGRGATEAQPTQGHLLLYLPADSNSQRLLLGQAITLYGEAKALEAPKNPDAFDFANWQAQRNVFHQVRLRDTRHWQLSGEQVSLLGYASLARDRLLKVLYEYLPQGSNELAVAAALILGKRDELSTDLRNAYAETGAIHVLAVSGLHVGLIAGGLAWLLAWSPLGKRRWGVLRMLIVLLGIWSFAFITGLSPSVQRAAVMFSFLEIGRALGERANAYNTLAASAFVLLLWNPLLIFDVGFQLSYLAVAGILFFQPLIYRLWYSPYRLIDGAWQLSSVAIAAQLVTFPISIYYFHQFPLYFLLSGLVVVVTASFILYLGIFLFAAAMVSSFLAKAIAALLYGLLYLNNAVIYAVQSLPGHLISGIWINEIILLLLYLMILLLVVYLLLGRSFWLNLSLGTLCLALAANVWTQAKLGQQRHLLVYNQYKATVVDVFDGRLRYTIGTLEDEDPLLDWSVSPHRQSRGVRRVATKKEPALHWYAQETVYGFYDKRLVWINDSLVFNRPPAEPLVVDFAIVSDSPGLSLAELSQYYRADTWIFDGSNYPSKVQAWLAEGEDLQIETHATAEDGYFVYDF